MAERTIPTARGRHGARERTRAEERYVEPPVDIYETEEGLVLLADLPGVSREGLEVRLEDNVLTIEGQAKHAFGGEPVHREYELGHFFRQFDLSEQIDQGRIQAELKHGVLTLRLPKAEKAKPRKIDIKVE
jgi:HSP20 family protein